MTDTAPDYRLPWRKGAGYSLIDAVIDTFDAKSRDIGYPVLLASTPALTAETAEKGDVG